MADDQEAYNHIKTEIGVTPDQFDLAIVSVDKNGNEDELNRLVLSSYGYELSFLDLIDVSMGFHYLHYESYKPILFIVTVGDGYSGINLKKNLTKAIKENKKKLKGKNVWIPLMATGAGGMEFVDSYDTTIGVLKQHTDISFTIAIPNNVIGNEFIKQFKVDNLQNENDEFVNELTDKFNRKIYLVGSSWGDNNDQIERFINQSIWENGYDDRYVDTVNSVKKGDLLLIKSTFAQKSKSILRIKAYGSVRRNLLDGKTIEIDWIPVDNFIDIDGLGYYRDTIVIPNINDNNIILGNLLKHFPSFSAELDKSNDEERNHSDSDFNEKYRTHRFVRDVLNVEYGITLVIEVTRILYGSNLHLDLADDKAKSFAVILKKEEFSDVLDSQLKVGNREYRIMSRIDSKIDQDIDLLLSGDSVDKYFAFFDDSFTKENIEQIKQRHKGDGNDILQIITLASVFKLAEKHGIKNSDYLTNESDSVNEEEITKSNLSEKIPFHLDQVVDEDRLGREPVAKAFVDLIKKDIFTDKLNHSFMVHLQGKWGAGKSSFLNFIKKNLNSGEEKWIIVEYNAWQNQHISPPWWSLIDQVYLKSKEQLNWRACFHLWRKEVFRRIWRYSGWDKITAFIIFLFSVLCIIYFGEDILNIFKTVSDTSSTDTDKSKSFASNFGNFIKLIVTLISIVGTLFAFAKFITVPFFINSSREAKSFVLRASDPMNKIKDHFNSLVDDINSKKKKRQLAIFIDDIDRCNKEFIVQLMEGIQTLFKEKRVLYIVVGDKNWITTSFGNIYEDFSSESIDKKRLGEFFLEKAFQLSFRLPNISIEAKQNYWDYILGVKNIEQENKLESIDELSDDKQKEIKSVLSDAKSELTNPDFMKKIGEDFNLTGDTVSNIVIEEKNKDTEELKHLLQIYHAYVDTNPRSIIRLANNYTMIRSTLMAERASFNEQKLFRWLAIESLYPGISSEVKKTSDINVVEEFIKNMKDQEKKEKCIKLFYDENQENGGSLTIIEIKTIKGL